MEKEQKDYSILKVFATLLVVFGHSSYVSVGGYLGGADYSQAYVNGSRISILINYVTSYIYSFHMPLFVFVSGAIYYYVNVELGKNYTLPYLLQNKFKRLLIPYFVVSILYVIPLKVLAGYFDIADLPSIVKYGILLGVDSGHLWYVFMLFGLFIVFNSLENIINKTNGFVTLSVMFLLYWFGYNYPTGVFQISNIAMYLLYFYIGYLFQKNKQSVLKFIDGKRSLFLVGLVIYFSIIREYHQFPGILPTELATNIFKLLLIICVALIGISISYLISSSKVVESMTNNQIYKILIKYSFTIYLLHDPLNYVLLALYQKFNLFPLFNQGSMGALAFTSSRFVITLTIPIVIGWIVSKIIRIVSTDK